MKKEIWKDIKGYEGLYQVSNLGRVKSLPRKNHPKEEFRNLSPDSKGYLRVNLFKNNKGKTHKVHRLVAEAFIPNPNNYPQVNHKDENKANNNVDNLEWCTNKYNVNYGHCRDSNKKEIICITTGKEFKSIKEASKYYNCCSSTIQAACKGKQKTGGFIIKDDKKIRLKWKYK